MVEELSPAALSERLAAGEDFQVVDVRGPEQFARGHLPGAINVPFANLPGAIPEVEWAETVVVVCPRGESSRRAARLVESYEGLPDGAGVYNLTGGYDAWDGDLVAGSDAPDGDAEPSG